jgi:carbon-monoxide dehydrogenase large subunit
MAETANSVHWADLIKTKIHMLRLEDPPLLRGEGQFTDDVASAAEPALSMVILRSPVAHGVINKIDVSAALKMPGVATILTANDPHIAAMAPMRCRASVADTQMLEPDRPVLADTHVKHVGEAIAAIVADDIHQALDAAGAIVLDIDTLPAVTDVQTAVNADDPEHSLVWPDIPANRAFTWEKGNCKETDALFAQAHHVARLTVKHPRVCIAPVETRAVLASYDTAADSYTLTTASQGVISLQRALSGMMGIDPSRLRVITHDTGGSFAVKIWPYAEHLLALAAAKQTGRTVRWSATRSEAMVADVMGRGRVDQAELALDKDGRFLAFRIDALADMGAYLNAVAPAVATSGAVRVFGQAYRIAGLHYRVQALYTNTMTTDAYRGAGKPESSTTLERVIDVAAREMNIDPVQLRQQNLVTPADLPYHTPMNEAYDGGDFPALAAQLAREADLAGLPQRRQQSRQQGKHRGMAVAFYLHATGGSTDERSEVRAMPDGTVRVRTGIQDNGQGHRTALAIVAAEALEIPAESIIVEQGDTEWLAKGGGTGGSNLISVTANTVHRAAKTMIDNATRLAGEHLEASVADIEYRGGVFSVVGTNHSVQLQQLAHNQTITAAAGIDGSSKNASDKNNSDRIDDCVGIEDFEGIHTTFPCGACACEVEVDSDTGEVTIVSYTSIDDVGRVFNSATTIGQIQGGVAQAAGEVLMEAAHYDNNGQLLSGSLMDYQLPRADDLPALNVSLTRTASPNALLDAKGVGELGSIGAPGPIYNAVLDALQPFGVQHLDKPLTPQKLWQSMQHK